MRSPLATASFVALFALPLAAQMPAVGERIQVTVVEVPVNVVNRAGDPVRNLTAANFELYDNGQRRAITHFEAIDLAAPALSGSGAAEQRNPAAVRNFLLLFDLNSSAPGTLARAKDAARDFIKSTAVRNDRIGVGTFTAEVGFRLLASFTTDMALVSAAIDTLGTTRMYQPADPLLLSSLEMRQAYAQEEAKARPIGPVAAAYRESARTLERAANDVQRQFIRRTLDGYDELARVLDRVPGRKQVILLSEGFDAKMIHGREQLTTEQARQEQQDIFTGASWRVDTDNRYGDAEIGGELRGMLQSCRRSDVVVNAIDIRGLRTANSDMRDTGVTSNESLFLLTHDTGGMVFKNANNIAEDFQKLVHAQEVVYVLGFEAPSREPRKYHELKVKLVNVPSVQAFHRAGYFESSPALTPVERTLSAAEIIVNRIPQTEIGVRTIATPFPRSEGAAQVPVIIEIDGGSLLRAAERNQIQSDVFVYAFDEKNVIRDFIHQPLGLDLGKLRGRLQQRGVRVYETLMLPPGHYSIRTLVRAGKDSRFGYTDAAIEVPAYGQARVLGGSAIDDHPAEWVPVKPPDRNGVPHDYPFLIDGAMLVPAAAPILRPGVSARVGLYGKLPGDVSVTASINGQDTPVKIAGKTIEADGMSKLLLDVTPPQLPPGDYELTLRVPQGTAVVPFAIR